MRPASPDMWASLLGVMAPGARLRFLLVWIGVALLVVGAVPMASPAFAQGSADTYPTKPVRVVVALAAGGGTDIQARLFSQKLSENFGRQFVVDNRVGAGGTIAYAL